MSQATLKSDGINEAQILYMAFELSSGEWRIALGVGVGHSPRQVRVAARDLEGLRTQIGKAKQRFGLPVEARVVSCYEAGRDGFWLHRYLLSQRIENHVVDSSSIEVNRRARRAKTDRLDAGKLLKLLMRYTGGEPHVWSVVRVPSVKDEDERRGHRELQRLREEQTAHGNRIRSLLATQGIVVTVWRGFPTWLDGIRLWNGSEVGPHLKEELLREYGRWEFVHKQILSIEKTRRTVMKSASTEKKVEQVRQLVALCGIGEASAWPLVHEFLWREFGNRREVGGASGLTGTPYASGGVQRDQGISKAGNSRIRRLMVEVSWWWLRYQPESAITRWFEERFAHGGKRLRRVGIVGVARRLLIALWRYLKDGVIPEGARLKAAEVTTEVG